MWTWNYKKSFPKTSLLKHDKSNNILFTKKYTKNFTQLIFSWNALRPVMGHFTFHVKIKNASSKTWSSWHKAFTWGSNTICGNKIQHAIQLLEHKLLIFPGIDTRLFQASTHENAISSYPSKNLFAR